MATIQKPSKRILYLAVVAAVIILVIFISKNHIASSVLGEKNLSYSAGAKAPANPCNNLTPTDPCVVSAIKSTVANDNSDNSNLTKTLSKNLFTSYLSAEDQNGNISDQNRINLIQSVVSTAPSSTPPAEKYTLGGLNVFDTTSADEIKAYGNNFASIYETDSGNYLAIANPSYDQTASFYQNLARDLSKIAVPRAVADSHLVIINDYNQMYVALLDLNNYQNDPLRGLGDAQIYQNNQNILPTFYIKIAAYFRENGIIFANNEPGSMWNSI